MHDRRPVLIARCATVHDVSAAIRFARKAGLDLTVRGGGHGLAGSAVGDGALVIDLSRMRRVMVRPDERLAEAQGGCLIGDLDKATKPFGLACPTGSVSHTGLGGLALGGGYGWHSRRWGLTCDQIVAAQVVLADGSIVEASETEHPDLLWALRGGGGGFGVVTRFTLRLHEAGPVLLRSGSYHVSRAAEALRAFQRYAAVQPNEVHVLGSLRFCSGAEWIPQSLHGETILDLTIACPADDPAGIADGAYIFAEAEPDARLDRELSYYDLKALGDQNAPRGRRYYTRSAYLSEMSDDVTDHLIDAAHRQPSPVSSIDIEHLRGAICSVGADESAFPQREAPFLCTAWAAWTRQHQDGVNIAWTQDVIDGLSPWQQGGGYLNYLLTEDSPGTIAELYGAKYDRLLQVKRRYDPDDVFPARQCIGVGV